MDWVDSPEYLEELDKFLSPLRNTVFWQSCWHGYVDITRFQSAINLVKPYISIEGKRVLDSGCGTGGLLLAFKRAGVAEGVGVELDANISRLATLRTRLIPDIKILNNDIALQALEPASFDTIISYHVIEHVADYEQYLQSLIRLLKIEGILLIACPNRLWPYEAHSGLPLLNYSPRPVAQFLGNWFAQSRFLPASLRDKGRTSLLYETDFTYFRLKKLLVRNGLEILEANHPRHGCLAFDLGLLHLKSVVEVVQRLPLKLQWYASILGCKDLHAVCRKKATT